jgi:hypothetical protein
MIFLGRLTESCLNAWLKRSFAEYFESRLQTVEVNEQDRPERPEGFRQSCLVHVRKELIMMIVRQRRSSFETNSFLITSRRNPNVITYDSYSRLKNMLGDATSPIP